MKITMKITLKKRLLAIFLTNSSKKGRHAKIQNYFSYSVNTRKKLCQFMGILYQFIEKFYTNSLKLDKNSELFILINFNSIMMCL